MDESELIRRYFAPLGARRADVRLGIGDDAALLAVPEGQELVLTTDALVEGTHFLPNAPARSLGHRALAVNLSDIAAMGAAPSWMLLSLVLPQANDTWLSEFCAGLALLAEQHAVALVGGNLSRGPLSITLQLAGLVPARQALRRDGASPGDAIYVSGTPGDAAAGRAWVLQEADKVRGGADSVRPDSADAHLRALIGRFEFPTPRVALGQRLRGLASACIDVSDGLYVDARRMLDASGCGGHIDAQQLPLSTVLLAVAEQESWAAGQAARLVLSGGEDYELCFCAPPEHESALQRLTATLAVRITRIGTVREHPGLSVTSLNQDIAAALEAARFDHFGR